MGYLSEKVSYIRGLADGLELGEATKEAKVLTAMIELLDDMAFSIEEMEEEQDLINDDLDEMDEIVGELEEAVYGDDCDCGCDCHGVEFEEITCPACNATIELDEDMLSDDCSYLICPECHEKIDIDWNGPDDCGCGCCHEEE